GPLQPLIIPLKAFPRSIPVQVLQIDTSAVVALPFEVTVESGRRIAAAVQRAAGGDSFERVVVSSVANEYCGYLTTAEEYSRQFYEGGHTLYGPNSLDFVAACAAELAAAVAAAPSEVPAVQRVPQQRSWDLRVHRYLVDSAEPLARPSVLRDPQFRDYTERVDGAWEFAWNDGAPGSLCWHQTLVRIEGSTDGGATWEPARHNGRWVDDQGTEMEVRHLGESAPGHGYVARWYNPAFGDDRLHRFVVLGADGAVRLASAPFS
ncbi:MAG: hypothetical protein GX868_11230, partial [Actinobacteria bacterium]|nr:hypothetical protein [Actinomycetota bacterium]